MAGDEDMDVVMNNGVGQIPNGFYRESINHSDWTIPSRYTELQTVGSGAYGSVCSAQDQEIGWVSDFSYKVFGIFFTLASSLLTIL